MYIKKIISKFPFLQNYKNYAPLFLAFSSLIVFIYTFRLSYKRYENYEFGKFDLGNMAQMVWNTYHGNFMQVTDQFGTTANRLTMSHADYILVLFSPLYFIFPHPMLLVLIQNIFLISAVVPLYLLAVKFTKSSFVGLITGLIYLLYPSTGYLLIWSEYHGVTHIAPILLWMFWYLEEKSYYLKLTKEKIIFWSMFVLMLIGKEQVGAIVGLFGLYIFLKNKKLGLTVFALGFLYTLFCFLYLMPLYRDERTQSLNEFLILTQDSTKEINLSSQATTRENFFLNRYKYLGDGYSDIVKNIFANPNLLVEKSLSEDKIENLNYLYKPFGFIVVLNPFWLVSSPDLAIALLADVVGFLSVENQRVVLIVMTLFISYLILIKFMFSNRYLKKYHFGYYYVVVCLILTIVSSHQAENPLFINGESFFKNKIISKVYSQIPNEVQKGKIPDNTKFCRDFMVDVVRRYDPQFYSGPNPLGDHTANRYMNAMFPAGIDKTDLFITDIYDYKAYGSLKDIEPYNSNITAVNKTLASGNYAYLYGCDNMAAFVKKSFLQPSDQDLVNKPPVFNNPYDKPIKLEAKNGNAISLELNGDSLLGNLFLAYRITSLTNISDDKAAYFRIKNDKNELKFLDYKFMHERSVNINEPKSFIYDFEFVKDILPSGQYELYYGFGDRGRSNEVYINTINL